MFHCWLIIYVYALQEHIQVLYTSTIFDNLNSFENQRSLLINIFFKIFIVEGFDKSFKYDVAIYVVVGAKRMLGAW
jgi:hypothetical protein